MNRELSISAFHLTRLRLWYRQTDHPDLKLAGSLFCNYSPSRRAVKKALLKVWHTNATSKDFITKPDEHDNYLLSLACCFDRKEKAWKTWYSLNPITWQRRKKTILHTYQQMREETFDIFPSIPNGHKNQYEYNL